MEQSTSSRSKPESYLPALFGPDEIEVADILLNLPALIQREFPSQFRVGWGGKRKRSAIDVNPSQEEEEEREKEKQRLKVKVEASSPTTPFSFLPSESDEKSKLSLKKPSTKTTREERLEIIDELTQRRELLKGEIEAVKSYYNKLKAINMDLKAKKQELEMCKKLGVELSKSNKAENQDYYSMVHQQPSIVDQTAHGKFQQHPHDKIPQFLSSGFGSGEVKQVGLDLNVSVEGNAGALLRAMLKMPCQATSKRVLDGLVVGTFVVDSSASQRLNPSRAVVAVMGDGKARAAEARRRRMVKMKEMKGSSFASIKSLKFR